MASADSNSTIFGQFLPYIPLILTILGWYVANTATARREKRKEVRAEVDACCKMLADILKNSRNYYTKKGDEAEAVRLGREMVFELDRVMQRIVRLEESCPKFDVSGTCGMLHEVATGGDFETKERAATEHNSAEIMRIEHWTHKTMDELEQGFIHTFR